ncbi:MAG: VCBS repeat-containing protein, partial [Rhizobiales bacterium]|nr:VCBS repeat-containing protein [Hyphomicrobiales bacterium]
GSNTDFALVRYNADGSLDTSFGGGDGKVTTPVGVSYEFGYSVTVQADGKILLGGESLNGSNTDFALVRYNADGSLDTSFGGGDGIVTTPVGGSDDQGYSVTVQADGKIVLGGTSYNGSNYDFALVRYNADGSLDTTFDPHNTLDGAPTFTQHGAPVVLDANVAVYDAELHIAGSYDGASLTLARHGGADASDMFGASGNLAFTGGHALLGGTDIGTVTNVNGELVITFNANATEARVNEAMHDITYRNNGGHPPASAQIDWTFSDGNSGGQGTGGPLDATGSTTVQIIPDATTNGDFGGDHIADILWRNTSGAVALWQLDNTGHATSMLKPGTVATSWHIEDTGDFNADGMADILWRNDSGQALIWTMDGNDVTSTINLGGVGTDWKIQGAADVNGDGVSDIVWRNSTTGAVVAWNMTDTGQVSSTTNYGGVGSAYHIQALADFNGDGTDDILWRNDNGQVALWQMDGNQVTAGTAGSAGLTWHIQSAGDFNGDGNADILWRNDSGQAAIWLMNGAQATNAQSIGNQGSGWTIETTGDYNGDGKDDILWHNDTSGQSVEWLMNGSQVASIVDLGKVPTTWSVAHHEFDFV